MIIQRFVGVALGGTLGFFAASAHPRWVLAAWIVAAMLVT